MDKHFLNLHHLAGAPLDDFALLSFEGREAISEPFDYRIEIVSTAEPDIGSWIGQLAEWSILTSDGTERFFAGRIYGVQRYVGPSLMRIVVEVRPAYFALSYARATAFVQDKTSVDIFNAMTGDLDGLVKTVSVSPTPAKRGYSVRYDETEIDYLARLLAQDGIMYFFLHDAKSGPYHHKMIVTNKASDYVDVESGTIELLSSFDRAGLSSLQRNVKATARKSKHMSYNVNKLDTPFDVSGSSAESWGEVYKHPYESIGFEAVAKGDVNTRQTASDQAMDEAADIIEGTTDDMTLHAGGRVKIERGGNLAPKRIVLTSVTHSARDPWMLPGKEPANYTNSFTGIDANKIVRPMVGLPERKAPGPLLGTITEKSKSAGEAVIDDQWRVPVAIANAFDYASAGLPEIVWLPVQQQWAHSTHGAQFFPRVGTRVIIDFLYGNPDLPFVSGTVYTPSQKYPFDPASHATQSGWRSVSDKNGSITQEFHFEDKPGEEEIYLYTGRDYRREIDQDDWGTVKRDQTLEVQRDQKLTVTGDRTVKIDGEQKTDITKTRTVTVIDKSMLESKKEIELKVGPSTIIMNMQGIEIKAPKITIKADIQLDMSGGAMASLKAPKTDVNGDGLLTLKGGLIMIN